ncbi:MAG: protein-L-isoaspartate O-methyltransferase [Candidatus Thermoplasmatota archaeon]|jgi:protein-L-isoaspartate(D-aspartate) O-methyltransferase|nr:protein-L-isoaspartate O-methyltransferase [Candidatus Thermoplasmatota archaeon]
MFSEQRERLVKKLKIEGYIKNSNVEKAFLEIPRENFVPEQKKNYAYVDTPLEIGQGQTISAPHMVAIMCEALDVKEGQKILEIGAGSGYHAAIVSKLVGEKGHVYTVERFKSLAEKANENLEKTVIKNVTVIVGDGSQGHIEHAPYDRIYVTCASPGVPPPLIDQLKDRGKLLIPVGQTVCELQLVEKTGKEIKTSDLGGCVFVPLVGKYGY